MKRYISILLLINTLFVFGQSKKEQITKLQSQLKQSQLEESSSKVKLSGLYQIVSQLKTEKSSLEDGILILKKSNAKSEEEKELYASKLTKSEEELKSKKDSIILILKKLDSINSNKAVNKPKTASKTEDFLNNYFYNQQPLNFNTFTFQIEKIATYGDYSGLPSILDADQFYLGNLPVNSDMRTFSKNNWTENISVLNSLMPEIEILKNKLVTLKKNNGEEASYLFKAEKSNSSCDPHVHIDLTSEEGSRNGSITLELRNINGEIYIVLGKKDFERIGVNIGSQIINTKECIECKSNSYDYYSNYLRGDYNEYEGYAAENQCWLVRKQNNFIDKDEIINFNGCGSNIKLLFKLIEK